MKSAFLQLEFTTESSMYTTFVHQEQLWRYTRLPFGTTESQAGLLSALNQKLCGTESYTQWYVDDILIASRNAAEHLQHLLEVTRRLQAARFPINADKCKFAQSKIQFLGFELNSKGFRPSEKNIEGILQHPTPTNKSEVRAYLRAINFSFTPIFPNVLDCKNPSHVC